MEHRVLVTGAGGFIGRSVVAHFLDRGWRVRAMVHGSNPFGTAPSLEVVRADMRDAAAVARAVSSVDAVVHLAAAKADEPHSEATNVGGAQNLIDACRTTGCRRIINLSTQSTKIARKGIYGRTKLAADDLFHASGLDVTTLLQSIVYDHSREGILGVLWTLVERLPVVPIFAAGDWVSAPVHVQDVSAAIVACLDTESTIGRRYDLAGPDQLPFDALIRVASQRAGRHPRVMHVPFGLSLLIARLLRLALRKPPMTLSNVLGSNQDTAIDISPARADFGFAPRRFSVDSLIPEHGDITEASSSGVLADEARLMARYILGVDLAPELVARYEQACAKLFSDDSDAALLFVRQHRWALPWLDAASGLCRPASALRRRVLVMVAILETTPKHASFFLAEPRRHLHLWARMMLQSVRSLGVAVIGMPLLLFVSAKHRWTAPTSS
jgi:NADH dehydrogenase